VCASTARVLYTEAFESAKEAGFELKEEPLTLTPQPKLVEIVRRSQELALSGEGGENEEPKD
jgi:CRISPR-associated protein Csb1